MYEITIKGRRRERRRQWKEKGTRGWKTMPLLIVKERKFKGFIFEVGGYLIISLLGLYNHYMHSP